MIQYLFKQSFNFRKLKIYKRENVNIINDLVNTIKSDEIRNAYIPDKLNLKNISRKFLMNKIYNILKDKYKYLLKK